MCGIAFERLDFATSYRLHLEPLPCWAHLSSEEYRRRIAERVEEIEGQAALQRQLRDLPAKGPAAILAQEPQAAPERLRRPFAMTRDWEIIPGLKVGSTPRHDIAYRWKKMEGGGLAPCLPFVASREAADAAKLA